MCRKEGSSCTLPPASPAARASGVPTIPSGSCSFRFASSSCGRNLSPGCPGSVNAQTAALLRCLAAAFCSLDSDGSTGLRRSMYSLYVVKPHLGANTEISGCFRTQFLGLPASSLSTTPQAVLAKTAPRSITESAPVAVSSIMMVLLMSKFSTRCGRPPLPAASGVPTREGCEDRDDFRDDRDDHRDARPSGLARAACTTSTNSW
mmetsp:Transcript_114766/g.357453  ORF Transcript_114766/g.357453 Transcript_114766/m.357453 type:complete len:205 (-) Transcript_114766:796-1410(-)